MELQQKVKTGLDETRMLILGAEILFGVGCSGCSPTPSTAGAGAVRVPAVDRADACLRAAAGGLTLRARNQLLFVALSIMLLMAPAAYHRIVHAGEDSERMHRTGSILVTAATLPLALGLTGDIYVVMAKIAGSAAAGLACRDRLGSAAGSLV
ncbi:MAG TPA: DUF6328 family protein, partial [Woeseiaceae bacterium]|nr:DUF6328 family protein [Woeseiaceae bacterium]